MRGGEGAREGVCAGGRQCPSLAAGGRPPLRAKEGKSHSQPMLSESRLTTSLDRCNHIGETITAKLLLIYDQSLDQTEAVTSAM
jgi:hypothetical protein